MEVWKEPNNKYLHFVEAEVLTGNSTAGQRDLILPPLLGEDPLEMFDSVKGPDISVIFSGYQALPKYIITCKVWTVIRFSFLFLCCCGTNTNVRILYFKMYLLSERESWLHSVLKQYVESVEKSKMSGICFSCGWTLDSCNLIENFVTTVQHILYFFPYYIIIPYMQSV